MLTVIKYKNTLISLNLVSYNSKFHNSVILNTDINSNNNNDKIENELDKVILDESIIDDIDKIEPISDSLRYSVDSLKEEIRKIREEETRESQEEVLKEEAGNISTFSEAFPGLSEDISRFALVHKLMTKEMPEPFGSSSVFMALKNKFIEDGLILDPSHDKGGTMFLKNVFKSIMEVGPGSINSLNELDSSNQLKEPLIEIKDGKLILNLKRSLELSPLILRFIIDHKDQIMLHGLSGALSIMLYYRIAVKLHNRAILLDDKYVMSLSESERVTLLKSRQKQISFFCRTGGLAVATSLFTISSVIVHYIKKGVSNNPISLLPFLKSNSKKKSKFNWGYIIIICSCLIMSTILHLLGINKIISLFNVYKFGLLINLLFAYIIAYNSISIFVMNFPPQRLENFKLYKYLPNFVKNYLNFYNITNPVLINYLNKLLSLGIVASILILIIVNIILLLFY